MNLKKGVTPYHEYKKQDDGSYILDVGKIGDVELANTGNLPLIR